MKVIFDTNVLLDAALIRKPFFDQSVLAYNLAVVRQVDGFVCASAITNFYYVARRGLGQQGALDSVSRLIRHLAIVPVGENEIKAALAMRGADFEDNVIIAAAESCGADAIVTRDATGFAETGLAVYSPAQLLDIIDPPRA